MEKLLNAKVCVVTGASRGIGAAIAAKFMAEGATVYAFPRTESAAAPSTADEP
ncbi:SDR family NAD(P)-dependent oxidoreductase, partial [bacterium]|nr:SDR family NAD(P)-dependent oxidoreductase [bacterium]